MALNVVILAAGKGTRMRSQLPKVLHPVAGKPMVSHVIDCARQVGADKIQLVYGHGGELLQQRINAADLQWVLQAQQLGTGHAVAQAEAHWNDDDEVLVLYGDTPLIQPETLRKLLAARPHHGMALLTVQLDDPTGYGRIIREQGHVVGIVEQKDANFEQLLIKEVNTGVLVAKAKQLRGWLQRLDSNNAQGEFYLTDVIGMAHQDRTPIEAVHPESRIEVEGANNRLQLAQLERSYRKMQANRLMLEGVTLIDPARFDLRGELEFGQEVSIDINVIIEGKVKLGNNVQIGAGVILKDCVIGDDTIVLPYSVIDGATIATDCRVGPFTRLRPGAELADEAHVGNFVEMKKAQLGKGSKCGHLTYLGDATVGSNVNIGAGTITCNYDGVNKFQTIIEDDVFVGSDTQLVAPVTIGKGATLGAGSTITRDVGENELVITRVPQRHIANWQKPRKK